MGDPPEAITTFGSLLSFALELEAQAEAHYRRAPRGPGEIAPTYARLAEAHGRRRIALERVRREDLNEAILEPISGLDPRAYWPQPHGGGSPAAEDLEEGARRFYLDAALTARAALAGVARLFEGWAAENGHHLETLGGP